MVGQLVWMTCQNGREMGIYKKWGLFNLQWQVGMELLGLQPILKKVMRMEIPVDKFPNFNFVGRLLGPRGKSLKRVEAITQCRIFIRGRGSVKDSVKEDMLRDKAGYEHLNEPLHLIVEAKFPPDMVDAHLGQAVTILDDLLKPVDKSRDFYKKNQLRELAILNGMQEESPNMSPSMSPFNSTRMKRPISGM